MGDLNDDPISPSVTKVLGAKGNIEDVKPGELYNPWIDMYKKGYWHTCLSGCMGFV